MGARAGGGLPETVEDIMAWLRPYLVIIDTNLDRFDATHGLFQSRFACTDRTMDSMSAGILAIEAATRTLPSVHLVGRWTTSAGVSAAVLAFHRARQLSGSHPLRLLGVC